MFERPPKLRIERARPHPSERNEQIFAEVRVMGMPQADVAQRYGVTQGRISAICQQVDHWHLWAEHRSQDETLVAQERRLTLLRNRHVYEQVCLAAARQHVSQPRELVTERTTNRGGQIATRRTVRKVRPSGQWLKIMEEALHAIDRISAELGPEVAPSRIYEQLYAMRSEFLAFHADEMDQSADGECPTTTGEAEQERRDADSEAGVPA